MMNFCRAAALALLFLPMAQAQTTPAAPSNPSASVAANPPSNADAGQIPTIRTGTSLVLVPTLVRTHSGQLVFSLTANDFVILDDGVPQPVRLDDDSDYQPVALVVVVETGGTGAHMLDNYRDLGATIASLPGDVPHTVAVVSFDSTPHLVQDFTDDSDAIGDTLNALKPGDGQDAILDALKYAVDMLRKQPPGYRRVILLISETVDHGSRESLELALKAISETNTSIYSLAFSSTRGETRSGLSHTFASDTPGPAGGCMSRDKVPADEDTSTDAGSGSNPGPGATSSSGSGQSRLSQAYDCLSLLAPPLRLAKIATVAVMNHMERNLPESVTGLTGGEYYRFEKPKNLQAALQAISNHLPNRYELSFQPQSPHPGLHIVEVRLKDYPKLDVTARQNYWADNAPAANAGAQ